MRALGWIAGAVWQVAYLYGFDLPCYRVNTFQACAGRVESALDFAVLGTNLRLVLLLWWMMTSMMMTKNVDAVFCSN